MSFDRLWFLSVACLPLAWLAFAWRRSSRKIGLVLKALALFAILLAIAEPRVTLPQTKVAVAMLVDTSASVPASDLGRASRLAAAFEQQRGRHWLRVIPFARNTRGLGAEESGKTWRFEATAGEAGRATDFEAAIRDAVATLPGDAVPRIALVSDGRENKGSIARAAWQARQLGIPIDTFALAGRPKPQLRLESISLPQNAFAGEQFPIDLIVFVPRAGQAEIDVGAEGRSIGVTEAMLESGTNPVRVHASVNSPGAIDLSVAVRMAGAGEARFSQSITLRRPRALYFSTDMPAVDDHLLSTLAAAQFDIQREAKFENQNFAANQLVIFNNWDLESIPPAGKAAIESYVKSGGGLLVIGGDQNIRPVREKAADALDRTLPASLLPPIAPEGRAVVIIIDRSTSMLGPKIEFARLAAAGVVENLRKIDLVGVLIFDTSFLWQVPIRPVDDREGITWLISRINANGGTRIAPALNEGYRRILETNAFYKHVILLTNGLSDEGNTLSLAKEAQANSVTISTVGLGLDVNQEYLQNLARAAGGRSYFMNDPQNLQQIVLSDVMEHTGTTAMENPFLPEVAHATEILNGVDIATAPKLKGYVRFAAKPTAETILRTDHHEPLLTRWQYGLGRSAVFTSDAKARWAADWIAWKGYDRFWANLARDLLPHVNDRVAQLEYDESAGELVSTYHLKEENGEAAAIPPIAIPPIYVLGPDGFEQPMPVKKIAPGTYRGAVAIGTRGGFFRVRPLSDSAVFPEIGLYRPEPELNDYGSDQLLLRKVAAFTGGRFEPAPQAEFDTGGRTLNQSMPMWPWLLVLGIGLNLAELILRKWKGLTRAREG